MNEAERMATGERATRALEDFVRPSFAAVRAEYVERLAALAAKPLGAAERAGIEKLALGVKVLDEVRGQIEQIASDGEVARREHERARRIESIPVEKRKTLGL